LVHLLCLQQSGSELAACLQGSLLVHVRQALLLEGKDVMECFCVSNRLCETLHAYNSGKKLPQNLTFCLKQHILGFRVSQILKSAIQNHIKAFG